MMKIKLNWGKGIILGMGAFMSFIVVLGVQMFKASPGDYDNQYYEKGLAYDTVYNKEKQVISDHAVPVISVEDNLMLIQFANAATGKIHFERPSDPRLDKTINFKSDGSDCLSVEVGQFAQGQWQVTYDWESSGKKYLYQREMFLP